MLFSWEGIALPETESVSPLRQADLPAISRNRAERGFETVENT
jgi:hypothetical protein